MKSEKKITTQENQKDEAKVYDNIKNKVYDYYLWEKNKNPSEKLYVISKEDLSKLKEIIKYADLKEFIKGDKTDIKACIEQFYKEKKIELKSSEENENIFIKIKEKKENTLDNNEEEINENVIDLYKSLGYKIEEDNKGKVDKTETKEKENENEKKEAKANNENNPKEKEDKRELEAKKEDKPENNVEEKQEETNEKKEEIKEEKKEEKNNEEKKEKNEVKENKDVPKEEVHKDEGNNEGKKEEKKEENEVKENENAPKEAVNKEGENKEEKKEENKEDKEAKENNEDKGKKEESKEEKKEEEDKDKIQDGKKDEKMTEKQDIKKGEINKENKSNENNKNLENDQKKEGQTQTVESEQSKEPSEKKKEIKNPEAQNIPKKKDEGENKEIANPPKQTSTNKKEEKEKTMEEKIREKIIDYDEDEKEEKKKEKETNEKNKEARKKSDITDKIMNNITEKEGKEEFIHKEEDKDQKYLNRKRSNDNKEIQNESEKDLKKEKEKEENEINTKEKEEKEKEENEINTKEKEEKEKEDINPENKENQIETQNNEQNTINNEENINTNSDNINNNNNNNNNIQDPQMTLQMMQFQEMFMKKYFFEHGSENSFINNYYQSASNESEEGLPQVVNGKIKLRSDIPSLGLQNVGATCYMNATLQCLMHIKELDEILLSAFFFNYPRENQNFAEKHKLSNQFVTLLSQVYFPKLNGNPNKYYAPYDFKNLISEINPLFAGYAANDAKDLLQCILENMHQELKQATQIFYDYTIDQKNEQIALQYFFNSYITQNKSPINDLLYGINEMKTTCSLCKITKYNFQCYNLLYFPLKEAKRVTVLKKKEEDENFDEKKYVLTLEDCFEHNEHVDHFTGDNQMYCNDCNKEADADYQTVLFTAPTILSIVLNRGRGNLDFQEDFKFGIDLDIKKYIHNQFIQNGKYYLIGMVVHLGGSDLSGHFIAYCRMDKNSDWFCYNDAFVDKIDNIEEKFNVNKPYILFYHYDNEENKEIKENENKENNENNEK